MGGNVSKLTEDKTIAAYTFYGFGCRCCNQPHFDHGAPRNRCCGTSGGSFSFDPPSDAAQVKVLTAMEKDLDEATVEAIEYVNNCSYVWCAQIDVTAGEAAQALNQGWCQKWNQELGPAGLQCQASSEVFGFGRSRVTYLVVRVFASKSG